MSNAIERIGKRLSLTKEDPNECASSTLRSL